MTTDRLAALLHEAIRDADWVACVHSPEGEWLPYCEDAAARLTAAGVTVAAQPAPDALRDGDEVSALAVALHDLCINCGIPRSDCTAEVHAKDAACLIAEDIRFRPQPAPDDLRSEWLVDCGIASCPFRGVEHVGHGITVSRAMLAEVLREEAPGLVGAHGKHYPEWLAGRAYDRLAAANAQQVPAPDALRAALEATA